MQLSGQLHVLARVLPRKEFGCQSRRKLDVPQKSKISGPSVKVQVVPSAGGQYMGQVILRFRLREKRVSYPCNRPWRPIRL
jgi:hypothetical protein